MGEAMIIPALKVLRCPPDGPCPGGTLCLRVMSKGDHGLESLGKGSPEGHWPKGLLDFQRGDRMKEVQIQGGASVL